VVDVACPHTAAAPFDAMEFVPLMTHVPEPTTSSLDMGVIVPIPTLPLYR
jgi:hypothetical protein